MHDMASWNPLGHRAGRVIGRTKLDDTSNSTTTRETSQFVALQRHLTTTQIVRPNMPFGEVGKRRGTALTSSDIRA